MDAFQRYFKACKVTYTAYLQWKTENLKIRDYQLKVCKKDLEIARAFLNVARRRAYR